MTEFLTLLPPAEALNKLLDNFNPGLDTESILSKDALGRYTGNDVVAPYPLPSFRRSTVDGYAVLALDTHGASEGLPAYLAVLGEVPMGKAAVKPIESGGCFLIHTGGMIPEGANAVVMVEYTQISRETEIEVLRSVADGENILQVGEDVRAGEIVIPRGQKLRPAEIGGLMALGLTEVDVSRQPLVGIISSGDEVVPPESDLQIGQVRDVNTHTLEGLVSENGGLPRAYGIVADNRIDMERVVSQALEECDLVIITAGSSASARDLTADVINAAGSPGVLVHGVNVRPGKPTILGVCNGTPAIGLPGNPVSALVIAGLFVVPAIRKLLGLQANPEIIRIQATLSVNLASKSGREDWVPVSLTKSDQGYQAEPVFAKSNLIFSLVKADGLVQIPANANGLGAGEIVEVTLI